MRPHPGGQHWERRAETYLQRQGLRTVERNFHCRLGEIDLVMRDGAVTVFVEVRYRRRSSFGRARESVTAQKQLKIARAAGIFLTRQPELAQTPCRFDVLSIDGGALPRIHWLKNAFQPETG